MNGLRQNRKGSGMVLAFLFLTIIVVAAAVGGFYVGNTLAFGSPSKIHATLAKNITVFDIDLNSQTSLEFIRSSESSMLVAFDFGNEGQFGIGETEYALSEWRYHLMGDPDAYMCVWGAGDDGLTYFVEIASFSGNTLKVTTPKAIYYLSPENPKATFLLSVVPEIN